MMYDYLIVGAGLTGIVLGEKISSELGKKVLIIDKRNHIGGNCYDYKDKETNITVHKYGPHVFHTNYEDVWKYLSKYTKREPFFYNVKAIIDSKEIHLPFNLNSIYQIFSPELAKKIENTLIKTYTYGQRVSILELLQTKNKDLKFLGNFVFKNIFEGYTKKQRGIESKDIDKSILSRVPILISRDNSYFQDNYQAIPSEGYTKMIQNIIKKNNLKIKLGTEFKTLKNISYKNIIYTGPIDGYFDYKYGKLGYRSLELDFRKYNKEYFQSGPQINYPNNHDFTRIVEYKYYLDEKSSKTIVSFEYPQEYISGKNEAYYPIINKKNEKLYNIYLKEAKKHKNIIFAGRLGQYKYFNMDQTVKNALDLFDKIKKNEY